MGLQIEVLLSADEIAKRVKELGARSVGITLIRISWSWEY